MNVCDFVPKSCYEAIKDNVKQRNVFTYEKEVKTKDGKFKLRFDGKYIAKDLAIDVWSGKDYLLGFSVDYSGPKVGTGGFGNGFTEYDVFDTWETFKHWFDRKMHSLEKYGYQESEKEYDQMSLF